MSVRPAAVANIFYPSDLRSLSNFIADALTYARARLSAAYAAPRALVVPHAGYIYSGLTAAFAYASLNSADFRRVVLLGPAHRVAFFGIALSGSDAFATPLGDVPIDSEATAEALELPEVHIHNLAHAQEHSLEVQLPFLQRVLDQFTLLPMCIGSVQPAAVARVIAQFCDQPETLFVISSDLSHYHPYVAARARDLAAIDQILALQPPLHHEQACGATGINALSLVARQQTWQPQLLDYRNSGDTAGDRDRVVGYAALVYSGREEAS